MSASGKVAEEILDAVSQLVADNPKGNPGYVRDLAEAYAWITRPNQPHGGQLVIEK